jgi:hypothetical protein
MYRLFADALLNKKCEVDNLLYATRALTLFLEVCRFKNVPSFST